MMRLEQACQGSSRRGDQFLLRRRKQREGARRPPAQARLPSGPSPPRRFRLG